MPGSPPPDTTPPTADITYFPAGPYKNGTDVTITATFSEAMADPPTPQISLSGAVIQGPANMTKDAANQNPNKPTYTYNYTVGSGDGNVTVSISSGQDLIGNPIVSTPKSGATFTIDNAAPTVNSIFPADGAIDVLVDSQIKVTFSEPVNLNTITIGGVSGTLSLDVTGTIATLTPYQLSYSTPYTVTVSGATDLAGNPLASPASWTFTTSAAADIKPPTADIAYSPTGPYKEGTVVTITANFSEAMANLPIPQISLTGAVILAPTNMEKVNPSRYQYTYTVGQGNGDVTVSLSNGQDLAQNVVVSEPTSNETFTIDNTAPTVTSVSPADGAINVPVDSQIKVTFSEPVNLNTITIGGVSGTLSLDVTGTIATLTPYQLSYSTPYTVTVSGATDLAGNPLASPASWTFTTSAAADIKPPTADIAYSPTGPYKEGTVVTITANFSEAMADLPNPQISLSGAVILAPTNMEKVNPSQYQYIYTVGQGNGDVTVSLSNGQDLAQNVVISKPTSNETFTIDNTAPTVTSVSPADGAINVPVDSQIKVTFSEAIYKKAITGSTFGINGITGTLDYNAITHTVTLTPSAPLAYSTKYSANITTGTKDLAGNSMAADYTWTFTTAPLYGDIAGTGGELTLQDAVLELQIAAGLIQPTSQQLANGDVSPLVNGKPHPDGKIDISDVVVILMKLVGLQNW